MAPTTTSTLVKHTSSVSTPPKWARKSLTFEESDETLPSRFQRKQYFIAKAIKMHDEVPAITVEGPSFVEKNADSSKEGPSYLVSSAGPNSKRGKDPVSSPSRLPLRQTQGATRDTPMEVQPSPTAPAAPSTGCEKEVKGLGEHLSSSYRLGAMERERINQSARPTTRSALRKATLAGSKLETSTSKPRVVATPKVAAVDCPSGEGPSQTKENRPTKKLPKRPRLKRE